jgi:hypothetical protein
MSESKLIERVMLGLLGREITRVQEIRIRWEDDVLLSLQWRLRDDPQTYFAKVAKEGEEGWTLLHRSP